MMRSRMRRYEIALCMLETMKHRARVCLLYYLIILMEHLKNHQDYNLSEVLKFIVL